MNEQKMDGSADGWIVLKFGTISTSHEAKKIESFEIRKKE